MAPMNQSKSGKENRVHTRVPVKLPVQYRLVDNPKQVEKFRGKVALAKDLSLEGIYMKIARDKDVKVGEIFRLDISLPETAQRLFAYGEVVWMNDLGVGLHLMLMPEEDKGFLKTYLGRAV
jgi:hypothetical protein